MKLGSDGFLVFIAWLSFFLSLFASIIFVFFCIITQPNEWFKDQRLNELNNVMITSIVKYIVIASSAFYSIIMLSTRVSTTPSPQQTLVILTKKKYITYRVFRWFFIFPIYKSNLNIALPLLTLVFCIQ